MLSEYPRSGPSTNVTNIPDIHALITEQLKLTDVYQRAYADRHTTRHAFSKTNVYGYQMATCLL
jgi:hypothetical protein